jgi:hypothetical protein
MINLLQNVSLRNIRNVNNTLDSLYYLSNLSMLHVWLCFVFTHRVQIVEFGQNQTMSPRNDMTILLIDCSHKQIIWWTFWTYHLIRMMKPQLKCRSGHGFCLCAHNLQFISTHYIDSISISFPTHLCHRRVSRTGPEWTTDRILSSVITIIIIR